MTTTQFQARVPAVAAPRPPSVPRTTERTLANGLRLIAVRRRGVPLVELRLRVPVTRGPVRRDRAALRLHGATVLSGTATRTADQIAEELQGLGATLGASAGVEELVVSGSTAAPTLRPFLELVGDVVTAPAFPRHEVAVQRAQQVQELTILHSQPDTIAHDRLMRRMYGQHPYGLPLPPPSATQRVSAPQLAQLHRQRVRPSGTVLVLVGDVAPSRALDLAEEVLAGWGRGTRATPLDSPRPPAAGAVTLTDRPGSVQTNIRMAGPALSRTDDGYAALEVANTVFGGYFSSRLVENIRERRGYTYSPRSSIEHRQAASLVAVRADVGTEVTAPALMEIDYELARMATTPVTADELLAAQRYLNGMRALSVETQAGLATTLAQLAAADIGFEFLRDHPRRVERVTADDVLEASARFLAPARLLTVLVGDADAVEPSVQTLAPVEVTT